MFRFTRKPSSGATAST